MIFTREENQNGAIKEATLDTAWNLIHYSKRRDSEFLSATIFILFSSDFVFGLHPPQFVFNITIEIDKVRIVLLLLFYVIIILNKGFI